MNAAALRRAAAAASELAAALHELARAADPETPKEERPRRARAKIIVTDDDRAKAKRALRASGTRGL